jgi:hypothetical protein
MDPNEGLKIAEVRMWRVVHRRAVAWKTARYTKGDNRGLWVNLRYELACRGLMGSDEKLG